MHYELGIGTVGMLLVLETWMSSSDRWFLHVFCLQIHMSLGKQVSRMTFLRYACHPKPCYCGNQYVDQAV